jgi:hypothetical protein
MGGCNGFLELLELHSICGGYELWLDDITLLYG